MSPKTLETLESVVVRLAGDSGDGMQVSGSQLSETTALAGNDLSSFPDFPAEIRAPAGTIAGVSGFQLRFASTDIQTPGDSVDVLVAMNPAALKLNLPDLRRDGLLIVNTATFDKKGYPRARNAERAVGGGTGGEDDRVVVGTKVVEGQVAAELDRGEACLARCFGKQGGREGLDGARLGASQLPLQRGSRSGQPPGEGAMRQPAFVLILPAGGRVLRAACLPARSPVRPSARPPAHPLLQPGRCGR